jgi:glycine/D-amino acid oxidase-like deaminating enzyme
MKLVLIASLILVCLTSTAPAVTAAWRQANEKELKEAIPARASVERERIETESRTASAVTDGQGKFIAGAVLITAGYAAEGKYSHFFITQVPISIASIALPPGEYVFGFKRVDDDSVEVKFYEAANGKLLGSVKAHRDNRRGPIRSLLINPPVNGKANIQIGRFLFEYKLST